MKLSTKSSIKSPINPMSLPNTQFWSEIKLTGKNIVPRSYHSSVVHQNKLFIYGGYEVHQGILADFYMLDFNNINSMQWVSLQSNEKHYPGSRWRHSCITINQYIYLFGGQVTSTQSTQDIHSFDLETSEWALVKYNYDEFPSSIDSHNGVVYKQTMIVFGGYLGGKIGKYSNQVHQFNFQTKQWSYLSQYCQLQPESRASAGACIWGDQLYMFGGSDGVTKYNDLWIFHLIQFTWTQVQSQGHKEKSTYSPQPRHGLSLNMYEGCLYLFGGIRDVTRERNDMHVFVTSIQRWVQITQIQHIDSRALSQDQRQSQNSVIFPQISKQQSNRDGRLTQSFNQGLGSLKQKKVNKHQLSPLMMKITKAYNEKQQYQLFFAVNITLANQQRNRVQQNNYYKQSLLKKKQFLKDLDIKTEREKEQLRMITPISGALRNTLDIIGNQDKITNYLIKQTNLGDMNMSQTRIMNGKYPCARDGHSTSQITIKNIQGVNEDIIVLFGGDRHLMSFNDIYLFKIQDSTFKLKQPLQLNDLSL